MRLSLHSGSSHDSACAGYECSGALADVQACPRVCRAVPVQPYAGNDTAAMRPRPSDTQTRRRPVPKGPGGSGPGAASPSVAACANATTNPPGSAPFPTPSAGHKNLASSTLRRYRPPRAQRADSYPFSPVTDVGTVVRANASDLFAAATLAFLPAFALSASARAAPTERRTTWLEAEWFDQAERYPYAEATGSDEASGSATVITHPGAKPATYELRAPAGARLHVWVRIADVVGGRRTGAKGVVVVNDRPSETLGGTGRGFVWFYAGASTGGTIRIALKGLTSDPNECFYDAVLVTDDASLDAETIAARQAELRRVGWKGRGPVVALVHGAYKRGHCVPAAAWDRDLADLQCLVEKWPSGKAVALMGHLEHYDVVLFTLLYRWGVPGTVFFNDLGAPLSGWIREGGLLVMAGARLEDDVAWLHNIDPALETGVGSSANARPFTVGEELRVPNPLVDGLDERPGYYAYLPWPGFPRCNWAHLEPAAGQALVRCAEQKPLLCRFHLGRGSAVTSVLFHGKGLDGRLLENLWAAHSRRLGRPYAPRPPRRTVADEIASLPEATGPAGPAIAFDRQGTMLLDEEPFFPYGFYLVNRDDSLDILRDKGFNCVFGATPELTERAHALGLRVVAQVSLDPAQLVRDIAIRRRQPAFVGYSIAQEPEVSRFYIMRNAAILKKGNPSKPRLMLVDHAASFAGMAGLGDFIVVDPYCVSRPDSPLNRVSHHVGTLRRLHPGKPVWTVLPAMRFAHYIVPSPAQFRALNYLAVVSGARGVLWFAFDETDNKTISYVRYADNHFEQPAWDSLCGLAAEMKEMTPWLVSPGAGDLIASAGPSPAVHAAAWKRGREYMLIVVNSTADKRRATIELTTPVPPFTPVFDSPLPTAEGKRLHIDLPGYGVAISRTKQ